MLKILLVWFVVGLLVAIAFGRMAREDDGEN